MFFSLITKKLRQQILESIIVQETYQEIAERVTDAMLNRSIAKINKIIILFFHHTGSLLLRSNFHIG